MKEKGKVKILFGKFRWKNFLKEFFKIKCNYKCFNVKENDVES